MFCDVRKFMPSWVMIGKENNADSDEEADSSAVTRELAKALGVQTKRAKGTLALTPWLIACDAYALAAAATGQWPLECSHAHKTMVLKIAHEGRSANCSGSAWPTCRTPTRQVVHDL